MNEEGKVPPGYYATWSGQFESMDAVQKMKVVIPSPCSSSSCCSTSTSGA